MTTRMQWMDALRGIAVLLVVLLHVPVVPTQLGGDPPQWLERAQFALQPYRMPMLLFLSGMLLHRSLDKGLPAYAMGKARAIAWPYVLWTLITTIVLTDAIALVSPRTWVLGYQHLWFLTVLLCCYGLGVLVRRIPAAWWPVPLILVAWLLPHVGAVPGTDAVVRTCWWAAFFFLGASSVGWLAKWHRSSLWFVLPVAAIALAWASRMVLQPDERWMRNPLAFLLSVTGILVLVWAAPRVTWPEWLQATGRRSIVVYLAHYPAIGGAYLALQSFGMESWGVLLPLLAVAGFGVPLLLFPWSRSVLFTWPTKGEPHRGAVPRAEGRIDGTSPRPPAEDPPRGASAW